MKGKKLLILLGALLVALAVAYELSTRPTSTELRRRGSRVFPGLEPGDVSSFTVRTPEGTFTCRRTGGPGSRWTLTHPAALRADSKAVQNIIRQLCTSTKQGELSPERKGDTGLADYGLDDPGVSVTLETSGPDERSYTLLAGSETGIAGGVWARLRGGKKVFSLSGEVADSIDVTLAKLRSKKLVPEVAMDDLESVRLQVRGSSGREERTVACEKRNDRWELTSPVHDLANPRAVSSLVDRVTAHTLKDKDFVAIEPEDRARYGLDSPHLRLTLTTPRGETTLLVGKKTEKGTARYAMHAGEPAVVTVPSRLVGEVT
ncbi:MAG: DUF4340 domain-containing protein, partial [Planctomycetota bacterium]